MRIFHVIRNFYAFDSVFTFIPCRKITSNIAIDHTSIYSSDNKIRDILNTNHTKLLRVRRLIEPSWSHLDVCPPIQLLERIVLQSLLWWPLSSLLVSSLMSSGFLKQAPVKWFLKTIGPHITLVRWEIVTYLRFLLPKNKKLRLRIQFNTPYKITVEHYFRNHIYWIVILVDPTIATRVTDIGILCLLKEHFW